jgi:hypothetical protein
MVRDYQEYLNSTAWKQRRLPALERAGFKCSKCSETEGLEVHHKTYERVGNESPNDLIVLCKFHHCEEHGIVKKVTAKKEIVKKVCSYVVGINRKIDKLKGLAESRDEIRKLNCALEKHLRRGKCSVCPKKEIEKRISPSKGIKSPKANSICQYANKMKSKIEKAKKRIGKEYRVELFEYRLRKHSRKCPVCKKKSLISEYITNGIPQTKA